MRRWPMMLAAATMVSGAALIGTAQATPIAPGSVATATQSTSAIQTVGWRGPGWHRWHRWGWRRPGWGWHRPWHRRWGWRRW